MSAGMESWQTTEGDVVEVWKSLTNDDWYWHVQSANGEVVGGGEGYSRKAAAIESALRHHPRVEVES